ncbi:MAG: hypothetical protein ABIP75_18785 [Pyrinomonadaceae bacterium]
MRNALISVAFILFSMTAVAAQDITGKWTGVFRSNGPSGKFAFDFGAQPNGWTGSFLIEFEDREMKDQLRTVTVTADHLEMSAEIDGSVVNFAGTVKSDRITGTFEVLEKGQRELAGVFCVSNAVTSPCSLTALPELPNVQTNTQRADPEFDTEVARPAFTARHPKLLFDEAHRNLHTTTGLFKPFADLASHDGFLVTPNTNIFSVDSLARYQILVIANARGEEKEGESAFTDSECDAVVAWVKAGGSLLFLADHAPMGGWAEKLSLRFDVRMSKGFTDDPAHRDPELKDLLFSRENGLLGDHAITRGRSATERIGRIVSFTGQSLAIPNGAAVILRLGDTAYDEFPGSEQKTSAKGRAQAVAFKFGKGRVFISGEAAMFSAQIAPNGERFGMNAKGIDNRQFALNVMHWLAGLLK